MSPVHPICATEGCYMFGPDTPERTTCESCCRLEHGEPKSSLVDAARAAWGARSAQDAAFVTTLLAQVGGEGSPMPTFDDPPSVDAERDGFRIVFWENNLKEALTKEGS